MISVHHLNVSFSTNDVNSERPIPPLDLKYKMLTIIRTITLGLDKGKNIVTAFNDSVRISL